MGWETWHEMEKDRNLGKNAKTSRIPDGLFRSKYAYTVMTKKLVDFGFSSPKISPENVCESGQQNLRPNVHKS